MPNTPPEPQPSPKKPICIDDLRLEELAAEIQKGLDSLKNGNYYTQEEVEKEFGL